MIADDEVYVAFEAALTEETLPLFFPGIDPSRVPLLLAGVGWVGVSPDPEIPSIINGFILRHSGPTPSSVTHFEAFLPVPQAASSAATGRVSMDFRPPQQGSASIVFKYWPAQPTCSVSARTDVTPAATLFAQKHGLQVSPSPVAGADSLTVITDQSHPTDPQGLVHLPPGTKALIRVGTTHFAYRSARFGAAIQSVPAPVLASLPEADLTCADLECYVAPLPPSSQRTAAKPSVQPTVASKQPPAAKQANSPTQHAPTQQAPPKPLAYHACPSEFDYLADHRQHHRVSERNNAYPAPYSSVVAPCTVVDHCGGNHPTSTLCLAHGRVCSVILPRAIPARYTSRACQSNWANQTLVGDLPKGLTGHPNLRRLASLTHLQLLHHHRDALLNASAVVLLGPRAENLAQLSWLGVAAPIICFRPLICASDTTNPLSSRGLNLTVLECAFDDSVAANLPAGTVVIALDVAYYPGARSALGVAADSNHLVLVAGLEFYPGPGCQTTMQVLG